jgi:ATP-dependent Clp protease ATP-binding subunit ClpC
MGEIYPEDEQKSFNQNRKQQQSKRPQLVVLDAYGTNISKLAAEGKLDPVVGREEEILRVVQILGRRRKNNPVLVGEPGVGKTAIVEGLALRIVEGNVPSSLQGKIIYTLELSTIVAGTKYRGQFEERMKAIVEELIANPHVIIFIDELHTLVGAGGSSGSLDASNIIKPALARGEIRCIGATTFDEFRENIEDDGALDRRFQKVVVDPPSTEETETILLNIRHKYESYHNVSYSDEIISLIVKLADNYIMDRYFPDKAVDILDEVGSYKHLIDMKVPKKITQLEDKLRKREKLKHGAVLKQDYELAAKERDACMAIKDQIEKEYAAWKQEIAEHKMEVTEDDVLKVVAKSTGIPIERITDKENKNLLGINDYLSSQVIGQKEAIDKIAITIQRNRIGIRKRDRTAGNFIFLGPTGVGKTQLAKEIAEYMFNSEDNLIRIDMSEYMEAHSISKLIGSPPGYVGHESGGFLTEQVKRKPHSVVLFDEVEKAHPDVFNVLLQMLDDGYLTDSLGRTIDFRNCLVILTSNTGARQVEDFGGGVGFKTDDTLAKREEAEKAILMKALNRKFSPEFLNRIDEIIIFNRLGKEDIMQILDKECDDLAWNLYEVNEYGFKITKVAKELIIEQGYDPKFGARPLRRTLERMVENPIAEMILKGEIQQGDTIKVTAVKGVIKIDVQ